MSDIGFYGSGPTDLSISLPSSTFDALSANKILKGFVSTAPSIEQVLINYTVPAGKKMILIRMNGTSDGDCIWEVFVDGQLIDKKRNFHTNPNVESPFDRIVLTEGMNLSIKALNRSVWGTINSIDAFIFCREEAI